MKLFYIVLALLSVILVPVNGDFHHDNDCEAPETVTQLDFFASELVNNTLHLPGGELRYEGTFSRFLIIIGLVCHHRALEKHCLVALFFNWIHGSVVCP